MDELLDLRKEKMDGALMLRGDRELVGDGSGFSNETGSECC